MTPEESGLLRIDGVVVCDDVRQEMNKKLIFIGVYADVIEVGVVPAHLRGIGLAFRACALAAGRIQFNVSVIDPQGNPVVQSSGQLEYQGDPGRDFWITMTTPPVMLPTEGVYSLRFDIEGMSAYDSKIAVRKMPAPPVQQKIQAKPN